MSNAQECLNCYRITDLLDELKAIVEKLCQIACVQSDYRSKLSKKLNESIEDAILTEFKRLYALYLTKIESEAATEAYILALKEKLTVPRKKRKWYKFWKLASNDAADLLDKQLERTKNALFEALSHRAAATVGAPPGPATAAESAAEEPAEDTGRGSAAEEPPADAEHGEIWEDTDETVITDHTVADPARG